MVLHSHKVSMICQDKRGRCNPTLYFSEEMKYCTITNLPFQWFPFVHPPGPGPQNGGLFPPNGVLALDSPEGKVPKNKCKQIKDCPSTNGWYSSLYLYKYVPQNDVCVVPQHIQHLHTIFLKCQKTGNLFQINSITEYCSIIISVITKHCKDSIKTVQYFMTNHPQ